MAERRVGLLAQLSAEVAAHVEAAACLLAAVYVGPGWHASALLWRPDIAVVPEHGFPEADRFALTLHDGTVIVASAGSRHRVANLLTLRIDARASGGGCVPLATDPPRAGALVVALAAAADGSPMVRLAAIHHVGMDADPNRPLPLTAEPGTIAPGGPVIDAAGRLIGMAVTSPGGGCAVLPGAAIARALAGMGGSTPAPPARLGASLRPISVPGFLRAAAGQAAGRLVLSVEPGGAADWAGLRAGDVLLTFAGQTISADFSVRGLLAAEAPGRAVELRLVRDGRLQARRVVLGPG